MGVAPAPELGRVSSNPPGRHAGNLDNRELVAGSTLYIPVFVPGALFEVGDGHAAQGDGEVDQTAIETSLRGTLQLTVRKDMKLTWPRAETATDYIAMATDPDLTVATKAAIQEMVDFLVADQGPDEASGLPAHQHRRERRDHAARRSAEPRRPRQDAEEHLQPSNDERCRRDAARARPRGEPRRRTATARGSRWRSKAARCAAWSPPAWSPRSKRSGSPTRSTPSTDRRPARSTRAYFLAGQARARHDASTTRTSTTAHFIDLRRPLAGRPIVTSAYLLDDVAVRRKPLDVAAVLASPAPLSRDRHRSRHERLRAALRDFADGRALLRRAARRRDDADHGGPAGALRRPAGSSTRR